MPGRMVLVNLCTDSFCKVFKEVSDVSGPRTRTMELDALLEVV